MAARRRPTASTSFDMLTADVVALMDALSIKRAHFCGISMGGMTALFLAQRHRDRFDRIIACDCGPASTPASAQQWKERIDLGAEKGMEALVDVTINALVPARLRRHQGAGARQGPRHDPHDAATRASPAAPQALSDYDLKPGLAGIKNPTLLIVRHQGRHLPRHARRSTPRCRARSWSSSKAPATSPTSSSRRHSPGDPGFPEGLTQLHPRECANALRLAFARRCNHSGGDIPHCGRRARPIHGLTDRPVRRLRPADQEDNHDHGDPGPGAIRPAPSSKARELMEGDQHRRRQGQHLGAHPDECAGAAPLVHRHRRAPARQWPAAASPPTR